MASLSEIIQLCRLCLVKDHVNISIFDDPENVRQIPLKISSCLPVKISRDDNLPKKICDGCSSKLDLCYDFWTSTAQAEKTLLCMAKEKENQVPEAVIPQPLLLKVEPAESLEETQICEPPVPKPIIVKKEVEPAPTSVENEAEEPAAKRPRRSAAIKAQMQIAPESDDDDAAEGLCTTEDVADVEDDIEDPDIPDMNVEIDDVKPGPSGLNQRSADSEFTNPKARQLRVLLVRHQFNVTENGVRIVFPITSKANKLQDATGPVQKLGKESITTFLSSKAKKGDITPNSKELIKKDGSGATAKVDDELQGATKKKETLPIKTEPGLAVEDSKLEQHKSSNITKPSYVYANFKVVVKLYCQKCGQLFDDFGELHRHIFQNTDKSHKFKCAHCKLAVGETIIHQQMHLKNYCKPHDHTCAEQKSPSIYFCEICGKYFKALGDLETHQRTHSAVKLRCPLCPWLQNDFTQMMFHYRTHVLNDNIELKCARCPLVFYSTRSYRVHCLAVHSQSVFIPYECILCPTVIVDDVEKFLFHVQAHCCIKPVTENKKPKFNDEYLTCELCSQIFEDKEARKQHEMLHPSVLLENRRCSICLRLFSVEAMWDHIRYHEKKRFNRMTLGKVKAFELEIKRKQMYDPLPKEGSCLANSTQLPLNTSKVTDLPSCPPLLSSNPEQKVKAFEVEVKKKQMYDSKPKQGFSSKVTDLPSSCPPLSSNPEQKVKVFELEVKKKQMYDPKPKQGFSSKVTALPSSCPPLSSNPEQKVKAFELEVKKKQMYDPKPKQGFSLTNSIRLPLNTSKVTTVPSSVTVSSYPEPTSSQQTIRAEPTTPFLEWSSVEGDPSVAPSLPMETNAKPLGESFPQPDLQYLDPSDLPSFF